MNQIVKPNAVLVISNDGKFKITGDTNVALSGLIKTELRVDPEPISLKVETTTDWPAVIATGLVGIAGIFTALVVGWFTHNGAKQAAAAMEKSANQAAAAMEKSALQAASATAAGIRNEWMKNLRNEAAEFYASVLDLSLVNGKLSITNGDEVKIFRMQKHRAIITMMIDARKPVAQRLIEVMNETSKSVLNGDQAKTIDLSKSFNAQATLLLEDAWKDIKYDLYGAAK